MTSHHDREWREQGYLVLPGPCLVDWLELVGHLQQTRRLTDLADFGLILQASGLTQLATTLLRGQAQLSRALFFTKTPESNWAVARRAYRPNQLTLPSWPNSRHETAPLPPAIQLYGESVLGGKASTGC